MLSEIVGNLLVNSTYSELPSLPPKMAVDVMSLSGSAVGLGDTFGPSVGHAQFQYLLPLLTASGVVVLGAAVLVSAWVAWSVSALAGKAGHYSPFVRTIGENSEKYG